MAEALRKREQQRGGLGKLNVTYFLDQHFFMKNAVIWDVAPYDSSTNRRFGGTYRLHH
jgi:hypothetical protein